jgi:hypothetical protein
MPALEAFYGKHHVHRLVMLAISPDAFAAPPSSTWLQQTASRSVSHLKPPVC